MQIRQRAHGLRWTNVPAVVLVCVGFSALRIASQMEVSHMNRPSDTALPGPSLLELVTGASVIVRGRFVDRSTDPATFVIDERFKGVPDGTASLALSTGGETLPEGSQTVFASGEAVPRLISVRDASRRSLLRLIAGLPEFEPLPDKTQLRTLIERSELTVFGESTPALPHEEGGVSAVDVAVIESLAGTAPSPTIRVERGPLAPEAGGPWSFPPNRYSGVFVLEPAGDHWRTVTAFAPHRLTRAAVAGALR